MNRSLQAAAILVLAGAASVVSQTKTTDITFGAFDVPLARWGTQTGTLEVTNEATYLKFLKVETDLRFEGEYLNPKRLVQFNYILPPGEHRTIEFDISVPGNFGKAMLDISIHDVVDTLDDILPGQDVFRQSGQIRFKPENTILPYLQERLTVPPRVETSYDFDYEFSRLLVLMLTEGKSPEDIAMLADVDVAYVRSVIDSMTARQYLASTAEGPRPTFPVLRLEQVQLLKPVADEFAARLAAVISENLTTLRPVLEQMVAQGNLSSDSNDILDGGTILYRPYPVVGALLLWFDLGQEFISDPRPLEIFQGSDPCNAHIPRYMYLVQGGALFNGSHFYNLQLAQRNMTIDWSDSPPDLECVPGYHLLPHQLRDRRDWRYPQSQSPEVHVLDTAKVYVGLRHLRRGAPEVLVELSARLQALGADGSLNFRHLGFRCWFWNLIATRTLTLLTEQGAVVPVGNGFYRFEGR